jgi:hypothetical protein
MKYAIFTKFTKIFIILVSFFTSFVIFEEIFAHYHKYNHYAQIFSFIRNSFYGTHIETDNFAIDIGKTEWFFLRGNDMVTFGGNYVYTNEILSANLSKVSKKLYGEVPADMLFSDDKGFFPIVKLEKITDKTYKFFYILDVSCNKSYKQINDWDATIYDCKTEYDNVPKRYITYKNEVFILLFYIDIFQSQYDKFFEGVRLKE